MSEEEQYDLFCTHCGQRITKDTVYCPSCGTQVSDMGGEPVYSNGNNYRARPTVDMSPRLKFLAILFTITAVYYLVSGIINLMSVDSTIETYKSLGMWDTIVDYFNTTMNMDEQETEDFLKTIITATAIANIVMGALVGVAAFCSFAKKNWTIGLVCCIIATIISSMSIFGLIVGIIVTYLYSTTKPCFQA